MNTQKSLFIWVMIVLDTLLILPTIFSLYITIGATTQGLIGSIGFFIIAVLLTNIVVSCIWLFKAFTMKTDLIKWTHILTIILAVQILLSIDAEKIGSSVFNLIILAIIWYTLVNHLKKRTQLPVQSH
jgi:hypothetical protein